MAKRRSALDDIFPQKTGLEENGPAAKAFNLDELNDMKLERMKTTRDVPIRELEKRQERTAVEIPDFEVLPAEQEKASLEVDKLFEESQSAEEAVSHAINTLSNPRNIKHFSELSDSDIKCLSALQSVNDKLRIKYLDYFAEAFVNYRVSHKRLGRGELKDIAQAAVGAQAANQDGIAQKIKRFFGG